MKTRIYGRTTALALVAGCGLALASEPEEEAVGALSPTCLAATRDGRTLLIGCATARRVAVLDLASRRIARTIVVPGSPQGLVLSRDDATLYVVCASPTSAVCVVDLGSGVIRSRLPAGHTAMAPVLSPDGNTLYVCNRFDHDVSVISLAEGRESGRVAVAREPVAAALTPDGRWLVVANHLHDRRRDGAGAAAALSLIDTAARREARQLKLPRGSGLLRGVAVSPDGRFAAVTHLLARYYLATTGVELGRMNCNALTLVDLGRMEVFRTVMLDQTARGAANPWAVTWTADARHIAVSHAGTHEVSLVEAPVVPQKTVRLERRISLPGNGPRALLAVGSTLFTANYFSDSLSRIDLAGASPAVETIELAPAHPVAVARQGEMLFNDARLCHQEWQSCASCHDADARMDGLNWDLLNDGLNNPKNAKSLLWAHATPPAMALGVRSDAATAVRAGLRHILFTEQPESVAAAIDEYLKGLQPLPSPRLAGGRLSTAALRGRTLFRSDLAGCSRCHPEPWFTDMKSHTVGTSGRYDLGDERFDTPALVELWRTAPYLHDGSAASVRDVLTASPPDRHGKTSHLTPAQLDDLAEYLLSL